MSSQGRRRLRVLCKSGLLVCLPLTGFIWALPSDGRVLGVALVLTAVSILLGFGAELLAASNEAEFTLLSAQRDMKIRQHAEELEQRDEKLRQYDRMAALLTEQNNNFRARLISLQVEMSKASGAFRRAGDEPLAIEDLPPDLLNAAGMR